MNRCQFFNNTVKQRLLSRVVLPDAYQRVEYLQSSSTNGNSGSIHIDTGLTYFADFEIECMRTNNDGTKICGVSANWCLQRNSASNPYYSFYNNNTSGNYYVSSMPITTRATLKWKNNYIYVNGRIVSALTKTETSGSFMLYGAPSTYYTNIRIYSFKAWDSSGNLLREMYPCYRKSDSVKGFYDIVNGTFYTGTGTGSFIAGDNI